MAARRFKGLTGCSGETQEGESSQTPADLIPTGGEVVGFSPFLFWSLWHIHPVCGFPIVPHSVGVTGHPMPGIALWVMVDVVGSAPQVSYYDTCGLAAP